MDRRISAFAFRWLCIRARSSEFWNQIAHLVVDDWDRLFVMQYADAYTNTQPFFALHLIRYLVP